MANQSITITNNVLKQYPSLKDHLNEYLRKRIQVGGPVTHLNGSRCWIYTGFVAKDGYGKINTSCKHVAKNIIFVGIAHRVAYMTWVSSVSNGVVQHKCDNPSCINPDHLHDGTRSKNTRDAFRRREFASPFNKTWKLTKDAVLLIRKLSQKNIISIDEIAKAFNLHPFTVRNIRDRKTYDYIE